MRLDDPRPDSAREADDHAYALAKENDPSTTMRDLSPLGIEWGENVLEVCSCPLTVPGFIRPFKLNLAGFCLWV